MNRINAGFLTTVIALLMATNIFCQQMNVPNNEQKMQWWKEAKFGMFIHWGLYALPAGKWGDKTTFGEWIMYQNKIPRSTYSKLANQFNPQQFNAEEYVKLAKSAGQKYLVFTTKHHDGFAMFKSQASNYNIVDATPFKRDVVKEIADACRKYDMKFGVYYSQAQDWYHPGGAIWNNTEWDSTHIGNMDKYIDEIVIPQVKEILSNYGDVAVLWWDTPIGMTKNMSQKLADLLKSYPNVIYNNRLGAGMGGDLETPEQFIPATGFPGKNWEVCMTMNDNWGYNAWDEKWKSSGELIKKLIDVTSKGGNFLLNVGPNSDGVIPEICQQNLHEIGQWLKINGEAIYNTQASPFPYLSWGRATRNGQKLYLHIFDWPENGKLVLPLKNKIKRAVFLANNKVNIKITKKNDVSILNLPVFSPDKNVSVIEVEFEGLTPEVLEAPSINKTIIASSCDSASSTKALTDNNNKTKWFASKGDNKASLEIDLEKTYQIQALGLIEISSADGLLNKSVQNFELQYLDGNVWKKIINGRINGSGVIQEFDVVKAQRFKLIFNNEVDVPNLAEWTLYRAN